MKKYSAIQALMMSFYSKAFFRDIKQNWRGTGFGFLFFLCIIVSIPIALSIHFFIHRFIDEEVPFIANQLPEITIKDGTLMTPNNETFYIRKPKTNELVAIISPSNETMSPQNERAQILVHEKRVIVYKSNTEKRIYSFTDIDHFVMNKEMANEWLDLGRQWTSMVLYPLLVLGFYSLRMIQALIFGLIALLISIAFKVRMTYIQCVRLSVFAMTPVLILKAAEVAGVFHLGGYLFVLIVIGYITFGILANKDQAALPSSS